MPVSITDAQSFTYGLQGLDKKGQPIPGAVKFDAPPTWASDNPTAATVALNADGVSGDVVGQIPGSATISVSGLVGGVSVGGSDVVTVGVSAETTVALKAGTIAG
jgi:hypothetical protein